MWINNLKIAWRQFQKKPVLSTIKIVGLGISIAATLLLAKYISWQWNFDCFHANGKEIVRIQNDHFRDGLLNSSSAMTYAGVPVLAKEQFPEVLDQVRLGRWIANDVEFRHGENLFRGRNCFFTDPAFFKIFSFELILGDPVTALLEPNSMVLSSSTAKTLFGDENPLGKEVLFENLKPFKITGVVADPPIQSHIQFDMLGSLSTMDNWGLQVYGDQQFDAAYVYVYLQLASGTDLDELANKITEQVQARKSNDQGWDEFKLQPLNQIHLYSQLDHEIQATGQGNNIWILSSIAMLILFLAWVNHFNLFSANVLDQSDFLSIRKIVGATRRDLFNQLACTALVFSILGLLTGIVFMLMIEPLVEAAFDLPLDNFSLADLQAFDPAWWLLLLILLGTIGIAILPAVTLSKIQPVSLLTKQFSDQGRGFGFRKVLVVFQFAIIVALIAATSIIYQQTRYMEKKALGANLEEVVAIRGPLGTGYEIVKANFPRFKQVISSLPGVSTFSVSHDIPGNQLELIENLTMNEKEFPFSFYRNVGDWNFFKTYQIPFLIEDTSVNLLSSEKRYLVINQKAAELLGFKRPGEALRKKINRWEQEVEIVGVVDNYHQRSLHHPVVPIIYDYSADGLMTDGYYSMRLNKESERKEVIREIRSAYDQAFPYTVFEPIEVWAYFAAQYQDDNNFKKLNLGFTLLGLLIACIGVLGLMIITVEKRTKELGIRKILGASVFSLVILLSKEVLKIAVFAWIIATPIVWYIMDRWLNNFSSHIELNWPVFVLAIVPVMIASFITTGSQALKAALINPAKILRDE